MGVALRGITPNRRATFGISVGQVAKVAAEHVLVQLLSGLDIPQAARIGADFIGNDQPLHIAFELAANFDLEIDQRDADRQHDPRQEIIDPHSQGHHVIQVLMAGPVERKDLIFADQRVAQLVVLVIKLDDRARQACAFFYAQTLGHGPRGQCCARPLPAE